MPVMVCDPRQGADKFYANCLNAKCKEGKKGLLTCKCKVTDSKGLPWVGQVAKCGPNQRGHICQSPGGNQILNGAPYGLVVPLMKEIEKLNPDAVCGTSTRSQG